MKKIRFIPQDYLLVFVVLQILLGFFFPILKFIPSPYEYLGLILIVLGIYPNFFWVPKIFEKENTSTRPGEVTNKLVTYGLFKYSRNPTYLSMALTLLGVAILTGSLIAFIFPILFIISTEIFTIRVEERILEKKFGKKYRDYKKKVRRWI